MILTIDTEKETVAGMKRAIELLEGMIASREPAKPVTPETLQDIPAVVHGTKKPELKPGIQVYE
jgi:hypothetical protein